MNPISEFYSGKTLFVTGATGYMGKVLLEKLVRSLPDLKKIYILVRPKKGCTTQDRVKQLTDGTIFTFHNINQKANEKIEAICGDITKEGFDMSEIDKEKLINEVSVVFHLAASIRMDLPLKEAVITNTKSTYQLFKFCMHMKHLKVVVHLSTAFCNADISDMEEKVYPVDIDPYKIMEMVEWMDEKCLAKITKDMLGVHPNTYTFTKRLSEIIALDMGNKIPLVISRPSIVIPSMKEPIPGWVDNYYGPMGLFIAGGKGIMRVTYLNANATPQTIPVDVAINNLIVSGYERATNASFETTVINVTMGKGNRYNNTWGDYANRLMNISLTYPYKYVLWYPRVFLTTSFFLYMIGICLFQFIPSLIIDFLLIMFLQKPFLTSAQQRIHQATITLHHFMVKEWTFDNTGYIKQNEKLDKNEKKIFYGTMDFDFDKYTIEAYFGAKKYLVKDFSENYSFYRMRNKILFLLDILLKFFFAYILFNWIRFQ